MERHGALSKLARRIARCLFAAKKLTLVIVDLDRRKCPHCQLVSTRKACTAAPSEEQCIGLRSKSRVVVDVVKIRGQ
jgi:hypothetical protein